ncbi:hypothetical protein PtB15_6B108 [Puccinia triticina]|nr:hypothetical protein PtB15_6B108 [Puccinia triticina]
MLRRCSPSTEAAVDPARRPAVGGTSFTRICMQGGLEFAPRIQHPSQPTTQEPRSRMVFARLGSAYLRRLQTHTLPTQMATAAVVFPLGDAISQHLIDRRPWAQHNSGLGTHRLQMLLSGITYPSSTLKTVLCRVAIDMALFTSFATCYFFTCMGLLEGRTWKEIQARIDRNYSTVVWTNISIFGPAQIINMSLVPVYGRPPFLNLVSLGYNCFLATLNNNTPVLAAGAAEN